MTENKSLVIVKPEKNLPVVVQDKGLNAYLEQIKKFPVLTEDEENALIHEEIKVN